MTLRTLAGLATLSAVIATAPATQAQPQVSRLHDALHLTSQQEAAWDRFRTATAADPDRQAQAQAAARIAPSLPTPRRLALTRAQLQSDLAAFDRTAQAVTTFYGQLTPEQQQTFDRETARGADSRTR